MTMFEPLPPCTTRYVPDRTVPTFLVRVWGKCDADYDPAEPAYVLMDILVSTPEDRAYHKEHKKFPDRDLVPYEGDHYPETTVRDVHGWCVENDIRYVPEINKDLPVPTMQALMDEGQFLVFASHFGLSRDPQDT